jgi:peptide deformylase
MVEEDGVGLAAPQVAESIRLFTYWLPGADETPEIPPTVLINPEIKAVGSEIEEGWEGCLSIPGLRGLVPRERRIKVKARSLDGTALSFTADGFHARVIQHELDHLDGVVFLDRMRSTESLAFEDEWTRYALEGADEGD